MYLVSALSATYSSEDTGLEDYEYDKVEEIIHEWERRTGLEMEIDESLFLSQKDVSNYILIEK